MSNIELRVFWKDLLLKPTQYLCVTLLLLPFINKAAEYLTPQEAFNSVINVIVITAVFFIIPILKDLIISIYNKIRK
jgi:hypothetical protein